MTDLRDLANDTPRYETTSNTAKSSDSLTIKVRRFANSAPLKITSVDPNQTVADFERNLAKKMSWADRTTRLSADGKLLDRKAKMGDVMVQLGDGQVLDTIPDHQVGAINNSIPSGLPQNFFTMVEQRLSKTDYTRIYTELVDLTVKKSYGQDFKIEVRSLDPNDLLYPVLYVNVLGRFYPFQLLLAGYPYYIKGVFLQNIPPCPTHGKRSPHVYVTGEVCWSAETLWEPNMALYEHYIGFLINILRSPKEHVICLV